MNARTCCLQVADRTQGVRYYHFIASLLLHLNLFKTFSEGKIPTDFHSGAFGGCTFVTQTN